MDAKPIDAPKDQPAPTPVGRPRRIGFDANSRKLLSRFLDQWVWPRWRQLAVALVLTACLAAVTGGYPIIIKSSFDTLLGGNTAMLPLVLGAIVVVPRCAACSSTCIRSTPAASSCGCRPTSRSTPSRT